MNESNSGKGEELLFKKRNSIVPLLLIVLIFLLVIVILIMIIYLCVHFKNVTITEKPSDESSSKDKEIYEDRAPLIGIPGRRVPDGPESLSSIDNTQIHYILAVEKAGGIPIILPVLQTFNSEIIKRQVEAIDAILIQGGLDVTPSLYNEEPKPEIGQTDIQTDNFLIEVIKQAVERKIPILGICRGLQILNVAFGGNLYQDLKYAGLESDSHRQPANDTCAYKHSIKIEANSILGQIFPNEETMKVNSLHHQAINKLANGFEVDAYSVDDKIIEAIHLKDDNQWIFAVQFHPEQHIRCDNRFLPIFKELIIQAKISRKKS
jgi:putative glutamine amidotransferase